MFYPYSHQIAFVRNNNIYLIKLLFGNSESQVTKHGEYNKVSWYPDWVYEEEFSYNRALDFSADSKMIAYVRFDESQVPMIFSHGIRVWLRKKLEYTTYPGYDYKYPKAGVVNSKVSVHSFDNIKSRVTRKMELPVDRNGHVPRI